MGKGDGRLHARTDPKKIAENWDRIFRGEPDAVPDDNFGGVEGVKTPLLPDGADQATGTTPPRRAGGATVEEWIAAIRRNPDRTLPGGVGAMLVAYYEARLGGSTA